jgi:hypothetical protein
MPAIEHLELIVEQIDSSEYVSTMLAKLISMVLATLNERSQVNQREHEELLDVFPSSQRLFWTCSIRSGTLPSGPILCNFNNSIWAACAADQQTEPCWWR